MTKQQLANKIVTNLVMNMVGYSLTFGEEYGVPFGKGYDYDIILNLNFKTIIVFEMRANKNNWFLLGNSGKTSKYTGTNNINYTYDIEEEYNENVHYNLVKILLQLTKKQLEELGETSIYYNDIIINKNGVKK